MRKDAFAWSDESTQAFNKLKEALMNTPVLALPDFSQPFTLQTDASGKAIGAVLTQNGHPLSYFSKPLPSNLTGASAYSREMYAVTEAIKVAAVLTGKTLHG